MPWYPGHIWLGTFPRHFPLASPLRVLRGRSQGGVGMSRCHRTSLRGQALALLLSFWMPRGCSDARVLGATLDGDRPLDCGLERSRVLSRALSARDVPLDPSFGSDDGLWGEVWSQYDHPTREEWPVERTLEPLLAPRPGDRFADLGAGGGYWSLRLARAVGPEGHVFATDISRPLMRRLAWLAQRRGLRQLTAVEVCPEAVGLPDASVDTALMTNVYRFEACNEGDRAYLERVWRALRPGGRFIVQQDFVHSAAWLKRREGCDQRTAAEVAALAEGLFRVERNEPMAYRWELEPGEAPGYLLVLRRVP